MPTTQHTNNLPRVMSILLIDDNEEDRYTIRRLLTRSQTDIVVELREADSGKRGLAMCRERLPDCILLDYFLYDTDGLTLLAELNVGRNPDDDPICPVVILTGIAAISNVAVRALREGAQDYLIKEVMTSEAIVFAVQKAVEKVRLRRRLFEAEARFHLSLDDMLDSFMLYSSVRNPKSGIIVDFRCEYMNKAAKSSFSDLPHYESGRLLVADLQIKVRAMGIFEECVSVVDTGIPMENQDFSYRGARAGVSEEYLGAIFHIRVWKMGDGIAVTRRDVTSQRHMAKSLAEAAARNERIAETLQRSMLLASPTGKFPGIAIETLYQAALNEASVGGDFFDAFSLEGEKVALVVGDVSGKGLLAAERTAEVKYALRAFLHAYPAPEIALSHLNDFICETHRMDKDSGETFIILALAVMDTVTGETIFSSAGAEPTLILRLSGVAERIEVPAYPLGIEQNARYSSKSKQLEIGETVLMATDGITEARRGYAFMGIEGMAELAEKVGPFASLREMTQAIYGGASDFSDRGLHDDVCLLVARRE